MSTAIYSISGNKSFTKVASTSTQPSAIVQSVDAVVQDLVTPPGSGQIPLIAPTGTSVTLSDDDLRSMAAGILRLKGSGLTADNVALTLGEDTAARAKQLLALLGINDQVKSRFVRVSHVGAAHAAHAISLQNTSGTQNYVQVRLNGGAIANTQILAVASASGDGFIEVSRGISGVAGQEPAVVFNIRGQQLV